jgi:hypothetical protein
MAKSRTAQKTAAPKRGHDTGLAPFDLDAHVDKYIWVLVPVLVLLYYWFSTGSTGFYQDDEIGHYRNIRQFWGDPFSIMGNQPKPGWKILMVLPGLLGSVGVVLAHCLVAALTVVMTYKLGRAMKMKNSSIAAILLAMQPLYLQLAFRSYSEITAALFIVLSLYWYYREQWIFAALASSYVFSIRQEFALVTIGLGVIFLMRRQWLPFILLGWTPVLLALIGWLHTGNIMWMLDDMQRIGLGVEVPHKPFWHYFETYIYMVGPVTLALLIVGYFRNFFPFERIREQIAEHGFLFFTYTIMFAWAVFSAWDVPDFGANPGHWRYMLSIAPLTALYAAMGFNTIFDSSRRSYLLGAVAAAALVSLIFLSRDTNGLILTDVARFDHSGMVVLVGLLLAAAVYARIPSGSVLAVLFLVGATAFTLYAEKPRTLDLEAQTVKQAAEWYLSQPEELQQQPLYCNHVLFRYFTDIDINDRNRDHTMLIETIRSAPVGSIVVWESHYGFNQFGGDVPLDYFEQDPSFKLLHQIIVPDRTFGIFIFEKTTESPAMIQPTPSADEASESGVR